jgi:hypothetical protein
MNPKDKSPDIPGTFALGLKSLQLQVDCLLEGCGGNDAVRLLDALGELNATEQPQVISLFISVIERLRASNNRPSTMDDRMLADFEEALYKDLLHSMREAANCGETFSSEAQPLRKLKLVDKPPREEATEQASRIPVDLAAERRKRMAQAN